MKFTPKLILSLIFIAVLSGCNSGDNIIDYTSDERQENTVKSLDYNEDRNVYFGDLHVHTKYSFDAFIFGTTATPDDAYRYAKGESIKHPLGFDLQLRKPLDFYAVTDHGFLLGSVEGWSDPATGDATKPFHNLNRNENLNVDSIAERGALFGFYIRNLASGISFWSGLKTLFTGDQARAISIYDVDIHRSAWKDVIESAQRHNDPGNFTSFIAYEYTSSSTFSDENRTTLNPNGVGPFEQGNLHRNVIYSGDKATVEPFTRLKSLNPEDLWSWMDDLRERGVDTIAIPHNSNGSNGQMFESETWDGFPMGKSYAKLRMRNEPLVEITQVKGTSETHPLLSPNDDWADFEIMDSRVGSAQYSKPYGGYVRSAYLEGLGLQEEKRGNPYKFGMVGASDTHTGAISDDESNFFSKVGILDGTPSLRGSIPLEQYALDALGLQGAADIAVAEALGDGQSLALDADEVSVTARLITTKKIGDNYYNDGTFKQWSASGLAVVWAEENTRESIFNAFRRKETYATSGTRIKLRFFATEGLDETVLSQPDMIKTAYAKGVPMGGEIISTSKKSPQFLVWAMRDSDGAALQRIQIVKGWVDEITGKPHEKIYDVVCSDGLTVSPLTNRCPDNGAKVNIADCSISNDVGSGELKTIWSDPGFNSNLKSFYYVRVLENPTCRWSTWDAIKTGNKPRPDLHSTIQERAWSSPIWYTPESQQETDYMQLN
jgi:hypothetical protein